MGREMIQHISNTASMSLTCTEEADEFSGGVSMVSDTSHSSTMTTLPVDAATQEDAVYMFCVKPLVIGSLR